MEQVKTNRFLRGISEIVIFLAMALSIMLWWVLNQSRIWSVNFLDDNFKNASLFSKDSASCTLTKQDPAKEQVYFLGCGGLF